MTPIVFKPFWTVWEGLFVTSFSQPVRHLGVRPFTYCVLDAFYADCPYFHTADHRHVDKCVNCLERNTGLQSLRVTRIVDLGRDAIPWLTSLLRSSTGALHLKEIIMDFFPARWKETVYWHPIDEVFEDCAFPGLTKVDIDFVICMATPAPLPSQKEISANVPSQFPRLHGRKILKVTPLSRTPGL